ncbi:hypothetical protein VFPPC_09477 [Pochonia chlamydosporia 170]|uniref:Uncharacterized protein n=1 Tax=Pochonia chlamydosporia 170 TaxID=1380566 RepID=A0A179F8R6_METCM|nr:hypothetical protein VFPPC_09477 [Pochonia chlamydosporia 170]OAQ61671.1 hypothetical protein VFPPC_09477 [Pochonia chlamydosporia 170]
MSTRLALKDLASTGSPIAGRSFIDEIWLPNLPKARSRPQNQYIAGGLKPKSRQVLGANSIDLWSTPDVDFIPKGIQRIGHWVIYTIASESRQMTSLDWHTDTEVAQVLQGRPWSVDIYHT